MNQCFETEGFLPQESLKDEFPITDCPVMLYSLCNPVKALLMVLLIQICFLFKC